MIKLLGSVRPEARQSRGANAARSAAVPHMTTGGGGSESEPLSELQHRIANFTCLQHFGLHVRFFLIVAEKETLISLQLSVFNYIKIDT